MDVVLTDTGMWMGLLYQEVTVQHTGQELSPTC